MYITWRMQSFLFWLRLSRLRMAQLANTDPALKDLFDNRFDSPADRVAKMQAGMAKAAAMDATGDKDGALYIRTAIDYLKGTSYATTAGGTYTQKDRQIDIQLKTLDERIRNNNATQATQAAKLKLEAGRLAVAAQNAQTSATSANNAQYYRQLNYTRQVANSLKISLRGETKDLTTKEVLLQKQLTAAQAMVALPGIDTATKATYQAQINSLTAPIGKDGTGGKLTLVQSKLAANRERTTQIDLQLGTMGGIVEPKPAPASTGSKDGSGSGSGKKPTKGKGDKGSTTTHTSNGTVTVQTPSTMTDKDRQTAIEQGDPRQGE